MSIHHYTGQGGEQYFLKHYTEANETGRQWQARYFQPHCSETDVVLDFGCGSGTILRNINARKRIGVEINEIARIECERLCDKAGVSVELHDGLGAVASGSVDVVISNHCLEHVSAPLDTLTRLCEVLRPLGTIVLVTPFDDWRNGNNRRWRANDSNHHLYTWSPMNLGNLLTDAGFQVEFVRVSSQSWSPRIFWVKRLFGPRLFALACWLTSLVRNGREVLAKGRKPELGLASPLPGEMRESDKPAAKGM
jgi:SAM-dependent methyltransferase